MKVKKTTGPSMLPWATLADIGLGEDVIPSRTTDCSLSDRNDEIQSRRTPWMPKDVGLVMRALCQTRSSNDTDLLLGIKCIVPPLSDIGEHVHSLSFLTKSIVTIAGARWLRITSHKNYEAFHYVR